VAGAGPLTSLAAGLFFGTATIAATALRAPTVVTAAFGWLAVINVVLAVFNLLPGAPLDGGRVLRALLWHRHGDRYKAATSAARAGHGLGMLLVFLGIAEVLFTATLNGLWLALLGWFLISASNAEAATARYHALLGRIQVRTAMHPNPVCGHPQQSVDDFVRTVAAHSQHLAFPLRDAGGHPAGLVRLADLTRIPAATRTQVTLSRIALPASLVAVVDVATPLADIAPAIARGGLAIVIDDGLLVGVLSADDVTHAGEIAALSLPAPTQRPRP